MTDRSGRDRLRDRSDEWSQQGEGWIDKQAGKFASHPVWYVVSRLGAIIVALFVLGLVSDVLQFGSDAKNETRRVLSVKNIKEQRTEIIRDWQAIQTATGNACQAVATPPDPNSPTLLEDPAFAYAATARSSRQDYERRQNNLFEAQAVGPKGYPRHVPMKSEWDQAKPDWCAISKALYAAHE